MVPAVTAAPIQVRPTIAEDIPGLRQVLEGTGLFPPDMLLPMLSPFLESKTADRWLTAERDGQVVGFCYTQPEAMTGSAWNMRAIGVSP